MTWRVADRVDRQVADLWAAAVASAIALLPSWPGLLSVLPPCPFRALTGVPCAGCGASRAAAALLSGHVLDAVLYNPLVALAASAFVVVGLAAPAWVRLGRRVPEVAAGPAVPVRIAIVSGLVGNWAYVIARGA